MKTLFVLLLSCVTICAAPKAGKGNGKGKPAPQRSVTLNAADWQFLFSPGLPLRPNALVGQPGWWFELPRTDRTPEDCWTFGGCPSVHYVMCPHTTPITQASLTITVQIIPTGGAPVFDYRTEEQNTCTYPAHVRAIIQKYGDNYIEEYGRWWSNPLSIQLSADTGSATITIPIDPSQWTSVFGKRGNYNADALSGWLAAIGKPGNVGLTFGGGCFFGHGVYVTGGDAEFALLKYAFE